MFNERKIFWFYRKSTIHSIKPVLHSDILPKTLKLLQSHLQSFVDIADPGCFRNGQAFTVEIVWILFVYDRNDYFNKISLIYNISYFLPQALGSIIKYQIYFTFE